MPNRCFCLFLWCVFLVAPVWSQAPASISPNQARRQFAQAQKLVKAGQYLQANEALLDLLPALEGKPAVQPLQVQALELVARNHEALSNRPLAHLFADSALHVLELAGQSKKMPDTRREQMAYPIQLFKAHLLYSDAAYDSALVLGQAALLAQQRVAGNDMVGLARTHAQLAATYQAVGVYDKALRAVKTSAEMYKMASAAYKPQLLNTYMLAAEYALQVSGFTEARNYITRIEQVINGAGAAYVPRPKVAETKEWLMVFRSQIAIAEGKYEWAIKNLEKWQSTYASKANQRSRFAANAKYQYAFALFRKGFFSRSIQQLEAATQNLKNIDEAQPALEARILDLMGVNYARLGDVYQAIRYHEKAGGIRQANFSENHPEVAQGHLLYAYTQMQRGYMKEADALLQKAFGMVRKVLSEKHWLYAETCHALGQLAMQRGDNEAAMLLLNASLDTYNRVFGTKDHPDIAGIYNSLAILLARLQKHEEALSYHLMSVSMLEQLLGKSHPAISEGYLQLSEISAQQGRWEEALKYANKSLVALIPGFKLQGLLDMPELKQEGTLVLSDKLLLESLTRKAALLEARSANSLSNLEAAFAAYSLAAKRIDHMRGSYKADGSKLLLAQYGVSVFEEGIRLAYQLAERTGNHDFVNYAFALSEKSKAAMFRASLAELKAKQVAGIPDSLIQVEAQLRANLSDLEKEIFRQQLDRDKADADQLQNLSVRLFEQKNQYERLVAHLEQAYPRYYQLKYQESEANLNEISLAIALKARQRKAAFTMVEYFVGANHIYIFIVGAKKNKLVQVPKPKDFDDQLRLFRSSIIFQANKSFVKASMALYGSLIAPVKADLRSQRLLIIPDATLANLPFEALIDSTNAHKFEKQVKKNRLGKLPYLLREYEIEYAYSAMLMLDMLDMPMTNMAANDSTARKDYLAFAPVFEKAVPKETVFRALGSSEAEASGNVPRDIFSNDTYIPPLPATATEVRQIANLFIKYKRNADVYMNEQASEDVLKSNVLGQYKYLHFATHGFVSLDMPTFSGLLLAKQGDSKEDGVLYADEIYALKINADLVVLSACETGLGKVVKGEGVIGLSRSFLYAGARNLMVSLWKVADASTSSLMIDFYEEMLDKRQDKYFSTALRRAKLNMLRSKNNLLPYYWAPFIFIGNSLD